MNRLSSSLLILLSLTTMSACFWEHGGDRGDGGTCSSPSCSTPDQSSCGDGGCGGCQTSAECGANSLCWALPSDGMGHEHGQCIPATLYVNMASSCMTGDGTQANPYCDIQTAIDAASPSAVIEVAPSKPGQPYAALTVSSQSVVIFAPMDARDSTTPAVIAGVNVSGTGYAVLSDVLVQGGGVNCAGAGAMLGLNRTTVLSSSGNGVVADPCGSLEIDASLIALSGQLGLRIGAVKDYQVTNSVIVQNNLASETALYGVYLGQASADKSATMFAFNTVADNGVALSSTDVGGVFCAAGQPSILNSIVAGNQGTQIGTGCTQSGIVVTATPDFTGGTGSGALMAQRYKLIAGDATDTSCCIEKAASANIDHDYYQKVRPAGSATTIGFALP